MVYTLQITSDIYHDHEVEDLLWKKIVLHCQGGLSLNNRWNSCRNKLEKYFSNYLFIHNVHAFNFIVGIFVCSLSTTEDFG